MFRVTCCLLILALCLSELAQAQAPGSFEFQEIPTFDESEPETLGVATNLNDAGEATGIAEDGELNLLGFVFGREGIALVPGFDASSTATPRAINGFGDVAGRAQKNIAPTGTPDIRNMPFLIRNGEPMLNLLTTEEIESGTTGEVFALNDLGTIAFRSGSTAMLQYPNGERQSVNALMPGYRVAELRALNRRDQLVGSRVRDGTNTIEAFLLNLDDQTATILHDPDLSSRSWAVDVNDSGTVVGYGVLESNDRVVPMLWVDGVGQQLSFPGEDGEGWSGYAIAINDRGDILGQSRSPPPESWFYWLREANAESGVPVHDLVDPTFFDQFEAFAAYDINNSREISGFAFRNEPSFQLGYVNKPGILRPKTFDLAPFPAPGLWADVALPGTGVEINRVDDRHFLIWYTYDEEGLPTWYFSEDVALERDGWRAEIVAFSRNESGEITSQPVGHVLLTNRSLTSLQFTWRLHGKAGTARFDYLPGACETGGVGHTGTWFDPADPGYGISLQEAAGTLAGVYYFYDIHGAARWVYLDYPDGPGTSEAWIFSGGPCPGCEHATPTLTDAGSAQLALGEQSIQLDLDVAGSDELGAIQWQSTATMMRLSSAPDCGAR